MLYQVTILNIIVVEELGKGDLPTGHNKCAAFDLHSDTTLMLLIRKQENGVSFAAQLEL